MEEVKIFTPATVANVGCGFDVLGFCLDIVGDSMQIKKTDKKGIYITSIWIYKIVDSMNFKPFF